MPKPGLLSLELPELEQELLAMGEPRYRARQLFSWIHGKGIYRPEEMGNLPRDLRMRLAARVPGPPVILDERVRGEDGTEKFRFRLRDGGLIESVSIPEGKRLTLCLSTQHGCGMGCVFCRTGRMGWIRDLEAEEILGQLYAVRSLLGGEDRITHVVLMGMGEPLANLRSTLRALRILTHPLGGGFSPRRITVSTVGIPAGIRALFREVPVSLTLSLNAADPETRSRLMPVNRKYPMEEVLDLLRGLPLPPRRRYTVAYVLIAGVNDRPADARRLVRLLHGLRCKVNLIPFNPFPESDLERPRREDVLAFQALLRSKRLSAHVRWSRGGDVLAACGQLCGGPLSRPSQARPPC